MENVREFSDLWWNRRGGEQWVLSILTNYVTREVTRFDRKPAELRARDLVSLTGAGCLFAVVAGGLFEVFGPAARLRIAGAAPRS